MTTMESFVVRRPHWAQGSLQAKQLNLAMVPVLVDSTIFCLKELKEDSKTSTWFKDHTGLFKKLTGEDSDSQKVIKNAST